MFILESVPSEDFRIFFFFSNKKWDEYIMNIKTTFAILMSCYGYFCIKSLAKYFFFIKNFILELYTIFCLPAKIR